MAEYGGVVQSVAKRDLCVMFVFTTGARMKARGVHRDRIDCYREMTVSFVALKSPAHFTKHGVLIF